MRNFYTDVLQTDARFRSVSAVRDLALLEPVTRAAVQAILKDAAAMGIPLVVTETYRSQTRQAALYAQGATQLRHVGVHGFGLAADFCKLIDGKASWAGDWSFLGVLATKHGMIWGGDWGLPNEEHSFRDCDHVQRIAVDEQNALFAGTWYPASDLPLAA